METTLKAKEGYLSRYLPVLNWLPKYQKTWFRPDLIAGLTVLALLIPEGMAYAMVAGVNPVYGLYTGMVTTIVAALTLLSLAAIAAEVRSRSPVSTTT